LKALEVYDADGKLCAIDGNDLSTGGLLETDLVKRINVDSYYKNYTELDGIQTNILSVFEDLQKTKEAAERTFKIYTDPTSHAYDKNLAEVLEGYNIVGLNYGYQISG
jgi:hypothetical protein